MDDPVGIAHITMLSSEATGIMQLFGGEIFRRYL